MSPTQNLVLLFFITQFAAIGLLIIAYIFDYDTFKQVSSGRSWIIPKLRKVAKLFSLSQRPAFQVLYFFSIVMILFSYVAFVLLVVYTVGWFAGLL